MAAAVEHVCADPAVPDGVAEELMAYFVPAAEHLRNDTGLPISSARPGTGLSGIRSRTMAAIEVRDLHKRYGDNHAVERGVVRRRSR